MSLRIGTGVRGNCQFGGGPLGFRVPQLTSRSMNASEHHTAADDPLSRYQADLQRPGFAQDAAQALAVDKLQSLYLRLCEHDQRRRGLMARGRAVTRSLLGKPAQHQLERGLYFWGGVGRGKTYLMDMFYDSLPFDDKLRVHFHRFMRRVHRELKGLQGHSDPLQKVADNIAAQSRVLCFDEFFVSDITDAMILAGMLAALFERGVTLVATSNIEPAGLYRDGLQRARFLPAIALLEQHTEIVNIDGGIDYRLRALEQAELYHWPLDASADESLMNSFQHLVPERGKHFVCLENDVPIEIEGREITARYAADDVVWFDFRSLCDGPRSQNDYIEIAREFHAVLISDIPQLGSHNEDMARRFINLVDEFYDHNIKLVMSAEVALEQLYSQGRLAFEFQRTRSRLQEMQSHDYLARAHKAD